MQTKQVIKIIALISLITSPYFISKAYTKHQEVYIKNKELANETERRKLEHEEKMALILSEQENARNLTKIIADFKISAMKNLNTSKINIEKVSFNKGEPFSKSDIENFNKIEEEEDDYKFIVEEKDFIILQLFKKDKDSNRKFATIQNKDVKITAEIPFDLFHSVEIKEKFYEFFDNHKPLKLKISYHEKEGHIKNANIIELVKEV